MPRCVVRTAIRATSTSNTGASATNATPSRTSASRTMYRSISATREFIKFMKLNDPAIKTVLVGCDDMAWNRAVLDAAPDGRLPLLPPLFRRGGPRSFTGRLPARSSSSPRSARSPACSRNTRRPSRISAHGTAFRRAASARLALDEWNIWNSNSSETYGLDAVYTWRDAVWVASALNDILACEAVEIANMAQMVNVIAPILADPAGAYYQTIAYPCSITAA